MERVALVLSAGGLRGAAHVGVLKVFERVGLLQRIHVVAGASAGSIVGAILASGASVQDMEQAVLGLRSASCEQLLDVNTKGLRDVACANDVRRFHGLINGQAITSLVENNVRHIRRFSDYATLPPDLQDKVKDLLLVGVNLDNGAKTVFCDTARYTSYAGGVLCGNLSFAEAVRASSSEPGVVTPFVCPGADGCPCQGTAQTYVDGALRESCPVKLAVELAGCTRVLAVNLGCAVDRVQSVADQGLVDILSQTITLMGAQCFDADVEYLRRQVDDGDLPVSVHIINPRLYDMGPVDFNRLPEAIMRGEDAAEWFLSEADRHLHIMKADGTVDIEPLFGVQGVFTYDYPDPERDIRRQRLQAEAADPRARAAGPCHIERDLSRVAVLAAAAVVSVSLALFTVGGLVGLRIKPNAASAADVFVFWDFGLLLFLIGWVVIYLLVRLWLCRGRR